MMGAAAVVPDGWRDWHALPLAYWDDVGDALVIEIPKKLDSPNHNRGYHWRARSSERLQWEQFLRAAVLRMRGVPSAAGLAPDAAPLCAGPLTALTTRYVVSAREYIRDDDNLAFAPKPLYDALKRARVIHDDRRGWLSMGPVQQRVAPDGRPRTVVILSPTKPEAGHGR